VGFTTLSASVDAWLAALIFLFAGFRALALGPVLSVPTVSPTVGTISTPTAPTVTRSAGTVAIIIASRLLGRPVTSTAARFG
jgi:hypothetical protein